MPKFKLNTYRKKNESRLLYWFIPFVLIIVSSCTDLSETINSEVTPDQFFQNEEQFVSALGDAYTILGTGGSGGSGFGSDHGMAAMNHATNDQMVVPTKGLAWFDGGKWQRLQEHRWITDEDFFDNAWNFLFNGVNSSNRLITTFQNLIEEGSVDPELAEGFIAELEVLRSFYYFYLLDNFGNVPIIRGFTDVENPANNPDFEAGRREIFSFIDSTVTTNIDKLSTDVNATFGRMNKFVAHMLLAKLYLNAKVYIDEPMWEEALEQLKEVDEGGYSLTDNYSANFVVENSSSPEIILAVPYDEIQLTGFTVHMMSLNPSQQTQIGLSGGGQPWNGYMAQTEFYNSYIDPDQNPGPEGEVIGLDGFPTTGTLDERLSNFEPFVGLQRNPDGSVVMDDEFNITNDESDIERGTVDPGPELRLTPNIDELAPNSNRQSGARIGKYELDPGGVLNTLSNDFVIYIYGDVLLMKAEAYLRLGQNLDRALNLVNQIRTRANVEPWTQADLTIDNLLAERGRELFYSVQRRRDQIRFTGKVGETRFNDPWQFKAQSPAFRNVFPIPRDQIEANPNLTQNPGY